MTLNVVMITMLSANGTMSDTALVISIAVNLWLSTTYYGVGIYNVLVALMCLAVLVYRLVA